MSWSQRRKIVPISKSATPLQLTAVLLDRVQQGEVKSILVGVQDKDGSFYTCYTTMTASELLMHKKTLDVLADRLWNES